MANKRGAAEVNAEVIPPTDAEGLGKIAVTTAAVAITFTGSTKAISLSRDDSNTAQVYLGKSNVTPIGDNAIGVFLADTPTVINIDYDDSLNALYLVASTGSQNIWAGALL